MAAKAAKVTPDQTPLSFIQYLQQSVGEQLAEERLYYVQQKKSEWEVSIAKTKAEVARAKNNLRVAFSNADLRGIIENTAQVTNLERGLAIVEEAFAVLFPAE